MKGNVITWQYGQENKAVQISINLETQYLNLNHHLLLPEVITRDTYTQCRASRSELVRLKVLVCEHDCCNRSMPLAY